MFAIPEYYVEVPTFKDAVVTMTRHGGGTLLDGMKGMDITWKDYCASDSQDDDEFFTRYEYEVNAYNVVYDNMSKLFV
jgi:hypothetical protein|tara:strand:- start:623 stop:856 length:234 start_codon:yes stop_codon:yes gene_type:complete